MKSVLLVLALLLGSTVWAQQPSTSFTLNVPTSNCISVLSQDGAATPAGQDPTVCPQGFYGGGDYEIYLLNDPAQSGVALDLYGCRPTYGPVVPSNPQTSPPSATATTTLAGCTSGYVPGSDGATETYSGSIVMSYVQKRVRCGRIGYCNSYIAVGGSGTLTLQP
jgi:hypothetical protein